MTSPFHVAIIGAGLGGLCLAQGLRRAGVPFTVYERDSEFDNRFQGYRLRINADGRRAIAGCLVRGFAMELADHAALASHGGRFVTPQLTDAQALLPDSWRASHAHDHAHAPSTDDTAEIEDDDLSMHRQTLREILIDGIADRVQFGKAFSYLTAAPGGLWTAHFADGTCSPDSIVVAADGAHSAVRDYVMPASAPVATGTTCVYGMTRLTRRTEAELLGLGDKPLLEGSTVVFADGFATVVDAMRFGLHSLTYHVTAVPDYLYWACFGNTASLASATQADSPAAVVERLAALTADWHPQLRTMLAMADISTVRAMPIRQAGTPRPWDIDGVTALGDACHTMTPAGGLGANTALQDAAALARALTDAARARMPLRSAIHSFERAMCERAAIALRLSAQAEARVIQNCDAGRLVQA